MLRLPIRFFKKSFILSCSIYLAIISVQCYRDRVGTSPSRREESPVEQTPKAGYHVVIPDRYLENIPNISRHDYQYMLKPGRSISRCNSKDNISSGGIADRRRKLLILFMVHSKADHFDHRRVIRETWGSVAKQFTQLTFLLGNPRNSTLQRLVNMENAIHADILQENFSEVYRNITLKNIMGLKWASQECANARHVVKSDDDVYINSKLLVGTMINSAISRKNLILCKIHNFKNVPREGKYRIDKSVYYPDYWPSFCFGGCWIMSMDVVDKLYNMSLQTRQIYLDDVYVTGILRTKLSLPISYLSRAYRVFCHAKGNSTLVRLMWDTLANERKQRSVVHDKVSPLKLWSYCFN